ncbi:unnamed protein product, partial [Adineta steineri]
SRLCDTKHCLRASDLTLESMGMNLSRKSCPGVILTLKCTGPSTPKHIIQFKPCVHGINHPEVQADFLKFSCRKIQILIQDKVSKQHYRGFLNYSWQKSQ